MAKSKRLSASDAGSDVRTNADMDVAPGADSLGTPTSNETPPNGVSGVKRAYVDLNGGIANDEEGENGQIWHNNSITSKRLKSSNPSHTSATESLNRTTNMGQAPSLATIAAKSSWPDILYCTRVEDDETLKSSTYYSDQKYKEWSDPLHDDDRRSASLLEIIRDVVGKWQHPGRWKEKSMEKEEWKDKTRHVIFSTEFTVKEQKQPLMRIHDPVCRSVLKYLIKYDPGQILTGDYLSVQWPWHSLMHYHQEIETLRDRINNGEAMDFRVSELDVDFNKEEIIRRIELLLGQINDVYTMEVSPELQNHTTSRLADFKKLWLLFKPGEEVFTRVNGELAAFIVLANRSHSPGDSRTTQAPIKQLVVHVWNLRLVAGRLMRHMSQITIDEYDGSRLIDTLPVFPCKYAGSKDEAHAQRRKLIERGKKYFSIIRQSHAYMNYRGLTRDPEPRKYNGRVIIDPMSYVKYGPKFGERHDDLDWDWSRLRPRKEKSSVYFEPLKPNEIIQPEDNGGGQLWKNYNGLDPTDPVTQRPNFLEDRHFLLLPQNIRGFSIRDKQWETYDVLFLSEINWGTQDMKDPFPGLILDEEKQKLIQANCRTAESRRTSPDLAADQIGGKGEGTVFLLHGPPGVGKTHTVECIANYTRQPLLSLSSCDIGATEDSETKAQHWFDLAKAWDALLLIDEADIFLTWRQPDNLNRDILVTAFLRTIESFPGTLFLTTNRIGQLDLAINSRVDIAIHFGSFNFESQKKLWQQYFDKINASAPDGKRAFIKGTVIEKFFADELVKTSSLSGREIRNAFKQSIKIARHENQIQDRPLPENFKLKLEHLKQAIGNCKEKTQHILNANRVRDESELAAQRKEREQGFVITKKVAVEDEQVGP